MADWAAAIAWRIADESSLPVAREDLDILRAVLTRLLTQHPRECADLIGTSIIEANYFEEID